MRTAIFGAVEEAIEDVRQGRFVIVVDSRDESSEGDLMIAGEACSAETVNFMATEARGVIFLCLPPERVDGLKLDPMTLHPQFDSWKRAMTVSIEAREGVTTGISAQDRARTIEVAVDPNSGPRDLVRPGHIFPLRASANGVLGRAGRTEAHVDLTRLAGFVPAAVICELTTEDGEVAHLPDLIEFAERQGLHIVTVEDVVRHRWRTERLLDRTTQVQLPTEVGDFEAVAFVEPATGAHHIALVRGALDGPGDFPVFVHAECLVGDVFRSVACRCASSLAHSLQQLAEVDRGVIVYVRADAAVGVDCAAQHPARQSAIAVQVLTALDVDTAIIAAFEGSR